MSQAGNFNTSDFNRDALTRLEKLGGEKFFREMIGLFKTHVRKHIDSAGDAVKTNDTETIMRSAHSIRSSAGNVGAVRLFAIATDIEQNSDKDTMSVLKSKIEELDRCFDLTVQWIKYELGERYDENSSGS